QSPRPGFADEAAQNESPGETAMKTLGKILWSAMAVAAVLFVGFSGYHSTDSTQVGVRTVKRLGQKRREKKVYPPRSAYFFLPLCSDWDTFDTRLQVVEMKGASQLTFKTRDGNDLFVDITFSYHIDPARTPYIRQYVARNDRELREK